MISYFTHSQVDKSRWDDCIGQAANRRVYAFSWYLDIVSPGWEALVKDDYQAVFPLTCRRKFGISYLAQPYFAQQLGVFSHEPVSEAHVRQFLHAIPGHFRLAEIRLNAMNPVRGNMEGVSSRLNHELDLKPAYEEIAAGYSQNVKRNLRKARECGIDVRSGLEAGEVIRLFRETYGRREGKLRAHHYTVLEKLVGCCFEHKPGRMLGSFTGKGDLSAAAFFLDDRDRSYFLLAASAPEARENGAMFILIDRFIHAGAGRNQVLDFEGGHDPRLGRFYKSFGAAEISYPEIKIGRLPLPVDQGLKLWRKLRK